jgi:hypothetical protein
MDKTDKLLARVRYDHGCWLWTGATNLGYGTAGGRFVHRRVYEALVGPIPAGRVLDHLCRTRACCNPLHLEVTTVGDNFDRGPGRYRPGSIGRRLQQGGGAERHLTK